MFSPCLPFLAVLSVTLSLLVTRASSACVAAGCLPIMASGMVITSSMCENSCSPDGTYTGAGNAAGCTAQYCNQYESGGAFHSRCTAGNWGHNYALEECQKTCGICEPTQALWKYDSAHSDEFDVAGRVDGGKKWAQELGAWTGTAPGVFKNENAVISSAKELVLTTKEEPGKSDKTCGGISTPLVVSSDTLSFGFYEIRAKMAKASLLSSFFLQSTLGGGEISIVDTVPASTKNGLKVSNSYHCFNPADGTTTKSSPKKITNLDPSDGFHTYGVDRGTDGTVKFYIDGTLDRTLTPTDASCLQQPMKVIFSMVTDNVEGVPSGFNTHTSTIQYFRHWTHVAKSVKSGNLKAGDEEDVITAAAVTTTTDNSSTDAEVARTVFGGIIAACCMYLVYIHATRKSAVYNAENSPPQAFDSMPTPAASNNANADNTARKNATISFI